MIKVVELFAGVGGFRVGLNKVTYENNIVKEKKDFDIVFFNQWEPSTKNQYAYQCYIDKFKKDKISKLNNCDISKINKNDIPNHDLLVGGFPCQDYSVARSLKGSNGIEGKKGVLWWQIYETLQTKKPNFVLLENVDRLLISPSNQRGRDFSIMLKCFDELGYFVEWKVINAADFGMPQKRKRIFIFACKKSTNYFQLISKELKKDKFIKFVKENKTFFTKKFKSNLEKIQSDIKLDKSILEISNNFSCYYYDSGVMFNGTVHTFKTKAIYNSKRKLLKDILLDIEKVDKSFFIENEEKIDKFKHLKGNKRIERISENGHKYIYSEGKMTFPENIELPGRTMLTSEGTINRSTHVIKQNNTFRFLTPIECERLNMFPDNWTLIENIPLRTRYFLMGNALVCGIVEKLSKHLKEIIKMENSN